MIYAIVMADLGDNVYDVATSLGKRVKAFGATPDYPIDVGVKVGIIQTGDIYCIYNLEVPLRSVLAVDNPIAYGRENPAQYFAAMVAHKIGNVKRLYEVWTAGSAYVNSRGAFVWAKSPRGGYSNQKLADWLSLLFIDAEKPILVDTELNKVVGILHSIKDFTPFWCGATILIPLCNEFGQRVKVTSEISYRCQNLDDKSVFDGFTSNDEIVYGTLAPARYVFSYNLGGKTYYTEFELTRNFIAEKGLYEGLGHVDAELNTLWIDHKRRDFSVSADFRPEKKPADKIHVTRIEISSFGCFNSPLPIINGEDWNETIRYFEGPARFDIAVGGGIKGRITMHGNAVYVGEYSAQINRRMNDKDVDYSGNLLVSADADGLYASKKITLDYARYRVDAELDNYKAEVLT